ncbi:MAG: CPBP family intramembrane metalloprotease [Blautia sp.]|nr:CPBP family intramembrane metalloprotease [Blautia sp.]MCM1200723.1 CPBP family intramembrane metalloprotease [Bacteroides fragilis]
MAEKRENTGHSGSFGTVGKILQPFLIYYVVYFITVVLLTYMVKLIAQHIGGSLEAFFVEQEATVNAIIGGLAMLTGILPLRSDFRTEVIQNNIRYETGASGKILITITLALTSSIAINTLFIAFHLTESSEAYRQVAEHQYGVFFPIGLFLYGVVSPLAEEIVFRGILYNRMRKALPVTGALVLSALLFGLYHGNAVQALYGFLMGMLLAYTYEKCGGFLYAFLFHAAANAAVYCTTGNPVLYERFITLPGGVVCGGVSVVLLLIMRRITK